MRVHVGFNYFLIDGQRAGHEANDSQQYKTLINHWGQAIQSLNQDGEAAAIPIDSEYCELGQLVLVLAAIRQGDNVVVRSLWIHDDWFEWEAAYILVSTCDEVLHYPLSKRCFATTGIFGEYNLQALATGLLNAEVMSSP